MITYLAQRIIKKEPVMETSTQQELADTKGVPVKVPQVGLHHKQGREASWHALRPRHQRDRWDKWNSLFYDTER